MEWSGIEWSGVRVEWRIGIACIHEPFAGINMICNIFAGKHRMWTYIRTASQRQIKRVHTIYIFDICLFFLFKTWISGTH